MKTVGKILSVVLAIAIVAVLALLAVNMFKSSYKGLEDIQITDNFKNAYAISTDLRTHTPGESDGFSENGGLYSYTMVYIEEAGYLQITVRYNERHMDDIEQNFSDFDMSKIHYVLTDNKGNTHTPSIVAQDSKYHYQYFKLEFTNIDFTDTELTLSMVIDAISDVVGSKSSIVIHTSKSEYLPYSLSAEEKENLTR